MPEEESSATPAPRPSYFDGERWVGYRTYVRLVRDGADREPLTLTAPLDVYRTFRALDQRDRECLYAISLDTLHRICGVELVSQGGLSHAHITPREIYKGAILANAARIVVVHNHPSGDPTPSADDERITQKLAAAGRILDIEVCDHVVIGHGRYVSFAESGLLG